MDVVKIAEALQEPVATFPKKALKAALAAADVSVPLLVGILKETLKDVRRGDLPVNAAPVYAMYVLAQLRRAEAYPLLVELFSLPGPRTLDLIGPIYDYDLHRLLASVSGGDPRPIQRMIENRKVHSLIRACGVEALATMALTGLVSRESVVDYLRSLLEHGPKAQDSDVVNEIVSAAVSLHPGELMSGIRAAIANDLLQPTDVVVRDAELALAGDPASVFAAACDASPGLIDDAVEELAELHDAGELEIFVEDQPEEYDDDDDEGDYEDEEEGEPVETFRHDTPPPGRNDPCPCGSGKKFKKCCGK
jgi:hypothetical protein